VFRDVANNPTAFEEFFSDLKKADVTLVTIDFVRYELLKGAATEEKYRAKEQIVANLVDANIPIVPKTFELVYELIKKYGIDGTALGITDLMLGSSLMQYSGNLCLMTRDTTDFLQNIFDMPFYIF
jgi:predicted nucleic acid-binding protein